MQEPTIDDFRDPGRRASFPLAMWLGRVAGYRLASGEQHYGRICALGAVGKDLVWLENLQSRAEPPQVAVFPTDVVTEVRPMEMRADFEQYQPTGEPMHPNEVLFMHLPFYRMLGRRVKLGDKHPTHPGKEGKVIGLYHGRGIIADTGESPSMDVVEWDRFELLPLDK